ncbi:MAG: hypothetical protein F8N36_05720 [Desulfovibrio sp.]|uniref:hypothetical protein n=1 Tax=Desulfovibrio sp. TaxID=885 RepID=UPI00135D9CAA|nr:hypothetical protein [Desulfovibrio sp.]MTJ92345.1 hypothetical protein [Desulfovibrio sp.]
MPESHRDQTTLEESFFFCEYAKRNFEMSDKNNGTVEEGIDYICETSKTFFKKETPIGMQIDLFTDVIYKYEAKKIGFQYNISFEGSKFYLFAVTIEPYIENFLTISNFFKVSAAFLPFPYDMKEIAMQVKCGKGVPASFKALDRIDRRCVVIFHNNQDYVYFGIDKSLPLDESIDVIKKQVILFKSRGDYKNCTQKKILKEIHKESKSGSYRQSMNNLFYKTTGLLIYDLYISNNFDLDTAFTKQRAHAPQVKCDPSKKPTSEDCIKCNHFSSCADLWKKQFNIAVEKISGTEKNETYLKRIRNNPPENPLKRRAINFFEYKFNWNNVE